MTDAQTNAPDQDARDACRAAFERDVYNEYHLGRITEDEYTTEETQWAWEIYLMAYAAGRASITQETK